MPVVVKQLKVINNAPLAADGTFSIGLRDPLVLKPNAKVGLSKFILKSQPPIANAVNFQRQSFTLTPNADELAPTPARTITVPSGIYPSVIDLTEEMNIQTNNSLVCGDFSGNTTFTAYVKQDLDKPTLDRGLEINYILNPATQFLNFNFLSNDLLPLSETQAYSFSNITTLGTGNGFRATRLDTWWGYGEPLEIVKGAYQGIIQVNQEGRAGIDWYFGLRYLGDDVLGNTALPRLGIYKDAVDGKYYLVDDGVKKAAAIATYTSAPGDYMILFTAGGNMYLQIYGSDPDGPTGDWENITNLKYTSPAFNNYKVVKRNASISYRQVIGTCTPDPNSPPSEPNTNKPLFTEVWATNANKKNGVTSPNGPDRRIEMDFANSGELASKLGFDSTVLVGNYNNYQIFQGATAPNFTDILDMSIFWSLPAHTYVGDQAKIRCGRENMLASFSPTKIDSHTLFFGEDIIYTDIGNMQAINISTLSFRIVNEYPAGASVPITAYLSFVLFFHEE